MANAKKSDAWDRTATLWALLANINKTEETLPSHPADIHPFKTKEDFQDEFSQEMRHLEKVRLLPAHMQKAAIKGMQKIDGH